MKILIVTASFYPDINGPVIYFDNISKEFSKMGHEVTIICGGGRNVEENFGKVRLLRYKKPSDKLSPRKRYEYYRNNAFEKICNLSEDFDVILSGSEIFLLDLKEKFDNNKIYWIVPSLRNIAKNIGNKTTMIREIRGRIQNAIVGIKLIVVSDFLKRQFRKDIGRKDDIFIVNPGVNLDKFSFSEKRENSVLFLGRMSKEKNVPALISAFERITNGKLILVGGGPKLEEIIEIVKISKRRKDIKILGMRKDAPRFYSKSKVFVLPSKYDAFPLVLFEAMASGLPCVAFKPDDKNIMTGSGELIVSGVNGFLVDNENEMAEKIDLLLSDELMRKRMSIAAKKTSRNHSWKRTALEILDIVKD